MKHEVSTAEWNQAFIAKNGLQGLPDVEGRWRYRRIDEHLLARNFEAEMGTEVNCYLETHRVVFLDGRQAFGEKEFDESGASIVRCAREWREVDSDVKIGSYEVRGSRHWPGESVADAFRCREDLDVVVGIVVYRSGTSSATGSAPWEEVTLYGLPKPPRTLTGMLVGRDEEAERQVEAAIHDPNCQTPSMTDGSDHLSLFEVCTPGEYVLELGPHRLIVCDSGDRDGVDYLLTERGDDEGRTLFDGTSRSREAAGEAVIGLYRAEMLMRATRSVDDLKKLLIS